MFEWSWVLPGVFCEECEECEDGFLVGDKGVDFLIWLCGEICGSALQSLKCMHCCCCCCPIK